jgi:hypothetical protein
MTIKEKEKVFNIVNTTTTEQQLYIIHLISDKISINIKTKKGVKCYEIKDPYFNINLNGIYIDINIQK